MPLEAEAIGDMGEGLKLQIFVEDDGDVIVSILPAGDRFTRNSVQFCTARGGSRNPQIAAKLRELVDIINNPGRETVDVDEEKFKKLVWELGR